MKRIVILLSVLVAAACSQSTEQVDYSEKSVAELHDAMQRGELSSEKLVSWYIDRIATIDHAGPELRSVLELNPDALTIARALDEEWEASGGPRGPMHGIPVLLKGNIDTADRMQTTAGSLALEGHQAAEDAFLVSRLRDAGAVILGKANLSEWANFRSSRSSSGWSSQGGQTKNPYDTTRNPCGSSSGSGVAVAANLTAVAVGTETDGSVVCPSGANGIVGIKPTLGLISRSGVIPIAHSQDTAGPMARTVRDAAILLTAMTGKDPKDADSAASRDPEDYAAGLAADGLQGKRIGVISDHFGANSSPYIDEILEDSIAAIEAQGATVVRDLSVDINAAYAGEGEVLRYEFKADLNAYLANAGTELTSIDDIIEFNEANADRVMPFFGQERMIEAASKGDLTDEAYLEALETSRGVTRNALDAVMAEHELDALIAPTNSPAWKTDHVNGDSFSVSSSSYAAISGYPNVTVPAGFVFGLPVGLSFIGKHWEDKALIEIAYAFEQATKARKAPEL
ncbi:MAG: amidase [Woeseiaceae bacterium]|nr:amidase [Woeseiaceae bacterium]